MNKQLVGGWVILVVGIAILVFGFVLTYKVRKYEFEHRTREGAVEFKNYGSAVFHRVKKGAFGSLMTLAGLMVVAGVVMIATAS